MSEPGAVYGALNGQSISRLQGQAIANARTHPHRGQVPVQQGRVGEKSVALSSVNSNAKRAWGSQLWRHGPANLSVLEQEDIKFKANLGYLKRLLPDGLPAWHVQGPGFDTWLCRGVGVGVGRAVRSMMPLR